MEPVNGWTAVQKSFGPDLYSGTSGIGILLAELAALESASACSASRQKVLPRRQFLAWTTSRLRFALVFTAATPVSPMRWSESAKGLAILRW